MNVKKFFKWKSEYPLEEVIKKYPNFHWDWPAFESEHCISTKFISENMEKPWNFSAFTDKFIEDKVSIDFISKYSDKDWNWRKLTIYFGIHIAEKYPQLPWVWTYFFEHKMMRRIFLEDNLELVLKNWKKISLHYFYRDFPEIVLKYPKPFWGPDNFSYCARWDIIETNPDYPWNWNIISRYNPNITPEIVKNNPDKAWEFQELIFNINLDLENEFIEKLQLTNDLPYAHLFITHGNSTCKKVKFFKVLGERQLSFKNIFEKISPFSRNVDKFLEKRINYV